MYILILIIIPTRTPTKSARSLFPPMTQFGGKGKVVEGKRFFPLPPPAESIWPFVIHGIADLCRHFPLLLVGTFCSDLVSQVVFPFYIFLHQPNFIIAFLSLFSLSLSLFLIPQVSVPIVSNDRCKSMFLRAGRHEFIPDIFLCAGHETGGQDSCQGDSGGPLQVSTPHILIGLLN